MKIISSRTHTYIGAVVGVVLIIAPWVLGFDEITAATASAVGVGLFVVVNEMLTTSPAAPLKMVPMRIHLVLDVVTGIFLLATPFLFRFSDEDANAWVPHVVVGVLIAGYALVTDTSDAVQAAGTDGLDTARRNNR
jgi:drug/metabolite transporter (DMT)-like permease